jgi:hypothetical protein
MASRRFRLFAGHHKNTDPNFRTRFSQLLRNLEIWMPHDFPFTLRTGDPTGHEVHFDSSSALCEQLDELNRSTWKADREMFAECRRAGAEHESPSEVGAKSAFSIMTVLARKAVAHRLIMKLDY